MRKRTKIIIGVMASILSVVVTTVASNSDSPEDGSGMVRILFPTSLD